jgi:hypothetical protein
MCSLCGVHYRRSQMGKAFNGQIRCSGSGTQNCLSERTGEELDAINALSDVTLRVLPVGGDEPHGGYDNDL